MDDRKVESKIRSRLQDYCEEPEEDLYNFIFPIKKKYELVYNGRRIAAAIVIFFVFGVSAYFLSSTYENKSEQLIVSNDQRNGASDGDLEVTDIDIKQKEPIGLPLHSEQLEDDQSQSFKVLSIRQLDSKEPVVPELSPSSIASKKNINLPYGELTNGIISKTQIGSVIDLNFEDNRGENIKNKGVKFYAHAMPTLQYNRVEANQNDDVFVSGIEKLNSFSAKRMGFRLESGVNIDINNHWEVFAGVLYFSKTFNFNYQLREVDEVEAIILENNQVNLIPSYEMTDKEYVFKANNLGLHLGVTYEKEGKNTIQSIGTGFEIHHALTANERSPSKYIFYNLFYRLEYPKEASLRFLAQPTFNYSFMINKVYGEPIFVKPYGLGLNLGFTFEI